MTPTGRPDAPPHDPSARRPRGTAVVAGLFAGMAAAWAGVAGLATGGRAQAGGLAALAGATAVAVARLRARGDLDPRSRGAVGWLVAPTVLSGWGTLAAATSRWDLGPWTGILAVGKLAGLVGLVLGVVPMARAAAASRRGGLLVAVGLIGTVVGALALLGVLGRTGD